MWIRSELIAAAGSEQPRLIWYLLFRVLSKCRPEPVAPADPYGGFGTFFGTFGGMSGAAFGTNGAPSHPLDAVFDRMHRGMMGVFDGMLGGAGLPISASPDTWECGSCHAQNPRTRTACARCHTCKPLLQPLGGSGTSLDRLTSPVPSSSAPRWDCGICGKSNDDSDITCQRCTTLRPSLTDTVPTPVSLPPSGPTIVEVDSDDDHDEPVDVDGWSCNRCSLYNEKNAVECAACHCPKPGPSGAPVVMSPPTVIPVTSSWKCSVCEHLNSEDAAVCSTCTALKEVRMPDTAVPGPKIVEISSDDTWDCPACSFRNASALTQCEMCETRRSSASLASEAPATALWTCRSCGVKNADGNAACTMCFVPRHAAVTRVTTPPSSAADGTSWSCPSCGTRNDSSRFSCKSCYTDSRLSRAAPPLPTSGDWSCPTCTFANKKAAMKCEVCDGPKPMEGLSRSSPQPSVAVRRRVEQDPEGVKWKCVGCELLNDSASEVCEVCGRSKPAAPRNDSRSAGLPASWTCSSCTARNERSVSFCEVCGHHRASY
jgi:hypothetical protein